MKANYTEIGKEILFPFFFLKNADVSIFVESLNYLEKMRGYPNISFWIPIAFAKIYFFSHGANLAQNLRIY